jgi:hypothetical protein
VSCQYDIVALYLCFYCQKKAIVKYKVDLTKEEHDELMAIIGKGSHSSQQIRTAYIVYIA